MRPVLVVVDPPFSDPGRRICHGQELGGVEAFLTYPAVKCFDIGIVGWSSWPGEVQFNLIRICPLVEPPPCELRPIVGANAPRFAPDARNVIQCIYDLISS